MAEEPSANPPVEPPELPPAEPEADESRRGFLGKTGALIAAGLGAAGLSPLAGALVDPIKGGVVRIDGAVFDAGPVESFDAIPRKIVVASARLDAWSRNDKQTVGAVYISRQGSELLAFSSICPHAGCGVTFNEGKDRFICPCHQTDFARDGARVKGPSPRGLDRLPVKVEDGRVLVSYERYRPGQAEQERV